MGVTLPWDCTVQGVPASVQSKGSKPADWKRRVFEAATERWPEGEPPLAQPLALRVTYLHQGQGIDVDNMLKYTLDGLIGRCYIDDSQLVQVSAAKHDLNEPLRAEGLSPILVGALVQAVNDGGPFVYLRLTAPLTSEEVL